MTSTDAQEVCSNLSFPFTFYNVNGSVETGVFNDDGLCIFPTANCGSDVAIQDCCQALPELTNTGSNYMFIAFAFILIPIMYTRYLAKTPEEREADRNNRVPNWVKQIPFRLFHKLFPYGLNVYVTAQVMVPIYMRQSLQEKLDVSSRNTLIAAEAFIVPYSAIFQFIEDIVLVRVNYALASGNKPLTNNLVHAGMVGSFATGFLAATLATILGVIPPVLQGLTNPGLSNDLSLYPDCDFVTDGNSNVLPYWLMEVWAIPGTQVGMVLSGFLFGALELDTLGWLGAIALGMIPLIWFTTVNNSTNRLLLLAGAEFTSAWALPILAIVFICSPLGAELREHTGFKLELSKLHKSLLDTFLRSNDDIMTNDDGDENVELEPANRDKNYGTDNIDQEEQLHKETETCGSTEDQVAPTSSPPPEPESTKDLLKDGLKIMAMDVAIQFCISLSVYLALLKDAATGYQLTALQSALPTYGIAYALGMGIVLKIVGSEIHFPQTVCNLCHICTHYCGVAPFCWCRSLWVLSFPFEPTWHSTTEATRAPMPKTRSAYPFLRTSLDRMVREGTTPFPLHLMCSQWGHRPRLCFSFCVQPYSRVWTWTLCFGVRQGRSSFTFLRLLWPYLSRRSVARRLPSLWPCTFRKSF